MTQKRARWILLVLLSFGVIFFSGINCLFLSQAASSSQIRYDIFEKSYSTIHTVTIPHDSPYSVTSAVSGELQLVEDFAVQEDTVAVINGGYFDPVNRKTTSFVIEQPYPHQSLDVDETAHSADSQFIADPRFNERLMDNPDLQQYLGKILNRAEFRVYNCGDRVRYDIKPHFAPILNNCTLKASLGGGPSLLPKDTSVAEAFTAYQDGKQVRNAIGSDSLNARSAVAITQAGDVILAMVAQQPQRPKNSGVSLPELTSFLASLGAVKAMNLDGGSSASLYYGARTIYGKVDTEGNKIKRPVKSVLLVNKNQQF